MGMLYSRIVNMGNSMVFDFDQQLQFKQDMLDRSYTAAAAKQAEILAQLPQGGGGGGSVAGFSAPAKTWISFGNTVNSFSIIAIGLSTIGAGGTYVAKGDKMLMFLFLFIFTFFAMYKASFLFLYSQQNNIATGTTFMVSFGTALAVAFIVSFFVYKP